MAKKIVKVNEEKIRGYMVGDIPDAIENEDIIVVEVPEEGNNERQDTEKETARKNSKSCNKMCIRDRCRIVQGFPEKYRKRSAEDFCGNP